MMPVSHSHHSPTVSIIKEVTESSSVSLFYHDYPGYHGYHGYQGYQGYHGNREYDFE